jgi:predicted transposase YdaD
MLLIGKQYLMSIVLMKIVKFLALSKDEQFAYQLDLKARLDYKNVLDYAKEEAEKKGIEQGFEKGLEEGIKLEKVGIAKSLLDILDVETIALKTVTEVQRLKDD